MDFMAVDSVGAAGGLLCIWNPDAFQMVDCCCNHNFIILSGTLFNNLDCVVVNIYAPNDSTIRRNVWDILTRLKSLYDKPWCLGGDFNEIRNISERKGCCRRDRGMCDFNDFIDNLEVCDMHMMGRKFTWCNSQEDERWSRIDRFLLSSEWVQNFNFKLWGLPRRWSDHCPILLMEDDREWGPKPFRFLNAWSLHPQFKSLVDNTWPETIVQGWASFKCLRKLKALKLVLKQWNIEVFGNVESKLKLQEQELHLLDLTAED
ncbi:uncharacterized protein LOC114308322 [Camellia sinensis]|uniref:uncharacterized protein LOC114308322 n=1 Tax=Camellia sinensis TaxID=4442 RepID=UPI001036C15E|nr:uncharacterized protein LOC114308322 [Camellia sinensis]